MIRHRNEFIEKKTNFTIDIGSTEANSPNTNYPKS